MRAQVSPRCFNTAITMLSTDFCHRATNELVQWFVQKIQCERRSIRQCSPSLLFVQIGVDVVYSKHVCAQLRFPERIDRAATKHGALSYASSELHCWTGLV